MINLFDKVRTNQKNLGAYPSPSRESQYETIRNLSLALHVEMTEFLQELPWKPWKPWYYQPNRPMKAKEELVDVFIFLLDLWLHLGGEAEDLMSMTHRKLDLNASRLLTGSHKAINEKE